MLTLSRVSNH